MLSTKQLLTPLSKAEGVDYVLERMQALGFETTGWQDGRIQKTMVVTLGWISSDFTWLVKLLAEFGFNAYAKGVALHAFSRSRFANEVIRARRARGPMRLTSTSSSPYTIEVGQLIAKTDGGVQFRNVTGGTLSAGSVSSPSTLQLTWEAVLAGSSGNVPKNAVRRLVTSLAGVSVANDEGDPWYTVSGRDEETDAALQRRNSTKWATLSVEMVAEGYENIALENGAVRVSVDDQNPRGPGTVDVYVAGASGLLGALDVAAIQTAFSGRTFHTSSTWPAPASSTVSVKHAPIYDLDITAQIFHRSSNAAAVISACEKALDDLLARTPLGGFDLSPGPVGVLTVDEILDALRGVEGVEKVLLTVPSTTLTVTPRALVRRRNWTLTPVKLAAA